MNKLRWGIMGTAGIARKNWRAIRDSGNSIVTAIASREPGRSLKFIQDCQREHPAETSPIVLGSYDALISSPNVDAVYFPLPTSLRKEWVLKAAAAGKHVLCEKPCGVSLAEVQAMTQACEDNGVQFMDGVMFMHNPRLARLRQILDDGQSLGGIKRITSVFSFAAVDAFFDDNIRVNSALEPTGCVGDLGWYCIRFALWAMNWRLPREVTGRILSQRGSRLSPGPVPTDFSAELIFDDQSSAGFYCSFLAAPQNWVRVGGAKGYLSVPDFVHAFDVHEPSFELNQTVMRVKCCTCSGAHNDSRANAQDTLMIRNFTTQVTSGKLNRDWPMWSLKTQQVLDACLLSATSGAAPTSVPLSEP